MHNLVIDIGNTNSKVAVFDDRTILHTQVFKTLDPEVLFDLIAKYQIDYSIISSVGPELEEVIQVLKNKTVYIPFSTAVNTGIKNFYQTLATLGLDRWAKIIAANHYHQGENCFIIDAGTCITYDLLNAKSEYFGGSISLGIDMRFKALNHYTGRLPLVDWDREEGIVPDGTDTTTAIQNGVLQGVINEVEGFIAQQNNKNKDLRVLITGGNGAFLLKQLKNSIFAPQIIHDPYLVIKGLNEVIAFEYVQKN
ncbi:type III pantothenate kinase [Pedobacter gandavensis]|uniref:Type III pantothenate kinase n=1 Tax=Pedobacter gandavensis TaxID=2679963 RepID=A0ABR6EXH8_9SPHI|nr:type III pantothenate kinase [Pedobacter gandavensis]MBB2149959.1 type III pantothenate kinase [Pedobacter gandavensis]